MSAGSFWPSPSSVTITSARAARTAGADAAALAEVPGVLQHAQGWNFALERRERRRRASVEPIVDEDDLGVLAGQRRGDLARQRTDILGLVLHGTTTVRAAMRFCSVPA